MGSKYMYHGIDITLDVYEKICSVVELMAEKENKSFDECYLLFSLSNVYELLQIEESLMWSESAEYLLDEYYRNQKLSYAG
ncbi:MAG: hypothetical protein Q4C77_20040 [Eubacteriales bacterium]|nr:hypothetical protein [Eubacteriales bacterium]